MNDLSVSINSNDRVRPVLSTDNMKLGRLSDTSTVILEATIAGVKELNPAGPGLDVRPPSVSQSAPNLDQSCPCVFMTTNWPDTFDLALLRAVRLHRKIGIPLPNEVGRLEILVIHRSIS